MLELLVVMEQKQLSTHVFTAASDFRRGFLRSAMIRMPIQSYFAYLALRIF